jgi:hypothetical protein
MAEPVESPTPLSGVQKLKLQLFHRLQRRHRDAWKRYWGSFQLYLAAQLSLKEFHALAEELLGPDKRASAASHPIVGEPPRVPDD